MRRYLPVFLASLVLAPLDAGAQIGTAFTYHGRLTDGGAPANGAFDFQLILYNAPAGGSQQGPLVTVDDVTVVNGVFTASLDFGNVFTGSPRWLEIAVRPGASSGSYSVLSPRQEVSPAPHAQFAAGAATATTVAGLTCDSGDVAKWSGSGWSCGLDNNTTYAASTGLQLLGTTFTVDSAMVARKDAAAGNQAFDTDVLFLNYANNRVGINTATPITTFHVEGGVLINGGFSSTGGFTVLGGAAAADAAALNVLVAAQWGGLDGPDGNDVGSTGGAVVIEAANGGIGQAAGDVRVEGAFGGQATTTASGGEGSDLSLEAGNGGTSAFSGISSGDGGDVIITAGSGGPNTQGGLAGFGGTLTLAAGVGATNSGGGNAEIVGGAGSGSGPGGDVVLQAGNTTSGLGGDVRMLPGNSSTGVDGAIELGGSTNDTNSTVAAGVIKVHVVGGDMSFTGNGDGIILRSPNGVTCKLLRIDNSGVIELVTVVCP